MSHPLRPWLALATAVTCLALPTLAKATVPGSNGALVFTSFNRGGAANNELYVRAANGTLTNLTQSTYTETDAAVSPDGTKVAFTSNRDAEHDLEIFVMPIGGGTATQLTHNTALVARLHPDRRALQR
jgi:dipeptidyl aminopeptidase/acylaminoacyl peptidase